MKRSLRQRILYIDWRSAHDNQRRKPNRRRTPPRTRWSWSTSTSCDLHRRMHVGVLHRASDQVDLSAPGWSSTASTRPGPDAKYMNAALPSCPLVRNQKAPQRASSCAAVLEAASSTRSAKNLGSASATRNPPAVVQRALPGPAREQLRGHAPQDGPDAQSGQDGRPVGRWRVGSTAESYGPPSTASARTAGGQVIRGRR